MFNIDNDYLVQIRREIHMYPEVDFDLPKTVALVKRELNAMGIEHTEKYGQGSVVGYINPEKEGFTIGIRADMDALNIQEANDVPYRSKIDGKMHACGHDAHTAVLLGAAKALKEMEAELACRVKLLFQPSEEGMKSGSVMMIEHGVLEDVGIIIGLHVANNVKTGMLGVCPGESQASSRHFTIEIEGRSAHAAAPQTGLDALAVAVRMYEAIQLVLSREIHPMERCLCSIGKLEAGTAQNVVAGHALMKGTIRAFNVDVSNYIFDRIQKIAKGLSEETGAKIDVTGPLKSVCVYNNPYLSKLMVDSMKKVVGEENISPVKPVLSSEDFSRFSEIKPGVFFRLGTGNEEKGCTTAAHNDDFRMDEDGLHLGAAAFVQFVLDNQHGVDIEKAIASDDRKN